MATIKQENGQMIIPGAELPVFVLDELNGEFNHDDIWFDMDDYGIIMDYSNCNDDMSIVNARIKLMNEIRF